MFDLVADVERYPEFVPWIIEARVRHRDAQTMRVDMTIGTGFLAKQFATIAQLDRPHRIDIRSSDPIVERFEQGWTFEPSVDGGTVVEYYVDFELRSRLLQMLIGRTIAGRGAMMVAAFNHRARRLYGQAHAARPLR